MSRNEILIFAGTTEGRELAEFLGREGQGCHVSVATEYGETLMEDSLGLQIHRGRLNRQEMEELFQKEGISLVIDATHPYAVAVSENIREACQNRKREYVRLLRAGGERAEGCIFVESVEAAVEYLKTVEGNVLVTTGSKELAKFTAIEDYEKRIFARVLSTPEVAASCAELGFEGRNLICMQGPFSEELNTAMLRQVKAAYLVTKDSGKAGGFEEKIRAAQKAGAKVVLIGRPREEEGESFQEVKAMLCRRLGLSPRRKLSLVGIGMGRKGNMTLEALEAVKEAEVLIGAKRMLEPFHFLGKPQFSAYQPEKIRDFVYSHPEYERVAILLSGDVGFYSGAKRLYEVFAGEELSVYSGISSVVYLCGKLHTSWEDVCLLSLHGRRQNLIAAVSEEKKVFVLVGEQDGIKNICQKLLDYGFADTKISVGERLSYEDELIRTGRPGEFLNLDFDPLCVALLENPRAKKGTTHGLEDDAFIRGKVPMTKMGVRSISLSKLRLQADSIVYDVGAGTGSVAVEMARMVRDGAVYAIEKKEEAVELIQENRIRFGLENLQVVKGLAPEALEELPIPTHVFIGGSSGNLKEIMSRVLEKNPRVRIVINAIALETVSEALEAFRTLPVKDQGILTAAIGEAKVVGAYHMMMGQNPVYILSCTGGSQDEG